MRPEIAYITKLVLNSLQDYLRSQANVVGELSIRTWGIHLKFWPGIPITYWCPHFCPGALTLRTFWKNQVSVLRKTPKKAF